MKRSRFIIVGLIISLVLIHTSVLAQPGDPGGDPDNPVPIPYIGLLVAAGVAFGARKLQQRNKVK